MKPARLVLNQVLRKPTLHLVVKIWEPQFLNTKIVEKLRKDTIVHYNSAILSSSSARVSLCGSSLMVTDEILGSTKLRSWM